MADGFRASSSLAAAVASLLDEDFVLADVGCSGGIDPGFRSFGARLRGYAFDPNVKECERLNRAETQRIEYVAAFVGPEPRHLNLDWSRLSTARSSAIRAAAAVQASNDDLTRQNRWTETTLSPSRVELPGAAPSFDFLKIDIDGSDFDVLRSIRNWSPVLGVSMEVNFFGGTDPDEHTFHNTDRFLRDQGFELFNLTHRRYSSATFPSRYLGPHPSETAQGRIIQGDATYFRDPLKADLTPDQVLKLAALFALAELPCMASETLIHHRERLPVDVDALLDVLAKDEGVSSYRDHLAAFEADDPSFYTA